MPKKATQSGAQGRKNKVLKRHIELTGSNKVPILDKSPPTEVSLSATITSESGGSIQIGVN